MNTNIIAACLVLFVTIAAEPVCKVILNKDLGEPQPLYLNSTTNNFVQIEFGKSSQLHVNGGESIQLFCTSLFRTPFNGYLLTAKCIDENRFEVENEIYSLRKLSCESLPDHSVRQTGRTCPDGRIVKIGFNANNKWLTLMEICHNDATGTSLWTHHFLTPENAGFQTGFDRTDFHQADFYRGLRVNILYTKTSQRKTIAKILGSTELADKLISDKTTLFLARGHLAAKSDFVFGSQQMATFYFINCAPQWQSFNEGNWATLEASLKVFISRRNINVELYTGTYGILKYNDTNGVRKEIYLANQGGRQRIPVPELYYKVVIAESINAGIVFIGVNDPYASQQQINDEYIICPDVSDKVKYIPWRKNSLKLGFSYACTISEFIKTVTHLPQLLEVQNLLI